MPTVYSFVAVVEDDAPVRRALVRVLVAAGFHASGYASAEEFLALTRDTSPDCVLVDIHLPYMDGLALLDRLRDPLHPTPVVLITADHEMARDGVSRFRGVPCLTKPVDEPTLLEAIASVTRQSSPANIEPPRPS